MLEAETAIRRYQQLHIKQELLHAVEFRTRRHVQLFRQLQARQATPLRINFSCITCMTGSLCICCAAGARWQCFDAYSRVCMSLGVPLLHKGGSRRAHWFVTDQLLGL